MKDPKVVPDSLKSPINYKFILCIIVGVISIHLIINNLADEENSEFYSSIFSIINPLATGVMGITVGFRYGMTVIFTRAYVALGIGFVCAGIGEILYFLYDLIFEITPFPSFADVFFLSYYPFILAHLVINIRFFKTKFSTKTKIWLIGFPLLYSTMFFAFYQSDDALETALSMAFIIPDSIALALAVLGAIMFRQGLIGTAWFILLLGMISISSADIVYYQLESLGQYSLDHPVNIFWYVGYWIIFYALYKHKQIV
ncbi:MAG: hypothetical protein JRZ94_06265 [Nitrososphaerota archaeon]|nr:hypothetical protein [Nitrososphaerota archaeon]